MDARRASRSPYCTRAECIRDRSRGYGKSSYDKRKAGIGGNLCERCGAQTGGDFALCHKCHLERLRTGNGAVPFNPTGPRMSSGLCHLRPVCWFGEECKRDEPLPHGRERCILR